MFCPYEVRYLSFPMSLTSSGWSPWRPRSNRACSPASRMISSTSFVTLSTVSSIRGGGARRRDTLGGVIGRVPLDGQRDHLLSLLPRLLLELLVDRADLLPGFHPGLVRDHLHEFGLCLLGRRSRDPLEVLPRFADHLLELRVSPFELVLQLGDLPLPFSELLRPGLEGLRLPVERVLLLEEAFLELADLVLPLAGLPL